MPRGSAILLLAVLLLHACTSSTDKNRSAVLPANTAAAPANTNPPPCNTATNGGNTELPCQPCDPPPTEGEYVAFAGGLKVYPGLKRVEMDVWLVGGQTRPLEFLVVALGGAVHESLFTAAARGEHLKRCLEIIGLQEAKTKRSYRGHFEKPLGDRVKISIRFRHRKSKKIKTVLVEDWLLDFSLGTAPEKVGFVFTGSLEEYQPDLNRSIFEGDLKGNLIALWRDPSCVLDNDRKNGSVPDVYSPNPEADGLPRSNTKVTLIFERFPK